MKKGLLQGFIITSLIVFGMSIADSNPSGSPGDYSSAVSNCSVSGCHDGNSLNDSKNGKMVVQFLDAGGNAVTSVKKSTAYTIKVDLSGGTTVYGFCLTMKDGTSNIGTFSNLSIKTKFRSGYVTQSSGDNSGSYSMTWTSPATALTSPKLYVSGNVANADGNSTGDFIYTNSISLTFVSLNDPEFVSTNFQCFSPENGSLKINSIGTEYNANYQVINLEGKVLAAGKVISYTNVIHNLPSGIAIVRISSQNGNLSGSQKVMIN